MSFLFLFLVQSRCTREKRFYYSEGMGDCFNLFLHLFYLLNTSCDKALNDTAVNGVILKLHKRLVSIYKCVCLFASSCTCHNLSVSKIASSVGDRMMSSCSLATVVDHLPSLKKEKRLMHRETLPTMICTRCTTTQTSWAWSPAVCAVGGFCFLIVLTPEWTISDVFLT